ncbi:ABC transporter G family member 20 [Orchesella cincta]|uniref:ABC transporter G family member 20 n=1 Tax=Orchesella cincta TaxID=48709 RepID=A0A1D2MPZ0_ORCCI|nr:ABC transporter G family member 20 [Orchesella cincta]
MSGTGSRYTIDSASTEPQQSSSQSIQDASSTDPEPPATPLPSPRIAIQFQNVVKTFHNDGFEDEAPALNNMNLEVVEGEMYVLMGPSGAGKSTVMLAIIGVAKLDSGKIIVCGKPVVNGGPNRHIGFMSTDTPMFPEFTVEENFHFFGKQHGLATSEVDETIELIDEVLKFKDWDKKYDTLSYGNKRLVSFASAIIHKPDVVVLDEITVGLDYPSAQKIYKLMRILKKRGMTFLIITHNAAETELADRMGLMVDGKLVLEGATSELKLLFEKESMEDVIYEACTNEQFLEDIKMRADMAATDNPNLSKVHEWLQKNQKFFTGSEANNAKLQVREDQEKFEKSTENLSNDDDVTGGWEDPDINRNWNRAFSPMRALFYKNWLAVKHDKWIWLLVVVLPALQICSIIHSIGLGPTVNVGVFNDELPYGTTECPVLNSCGEYRDAELFSCMFMQEMETYFLNYTYYKNEAEVKPVIESLKRGKRLTAYIGFNKSFSNSIKTMMTSAPFTDDDNTAFQLRMGYDASNPVLREFFFRAVILGYVAFSHNVKRECNYTTSVAGNIINRIPIFEADDFFGKYLSTCSLVGILWFFPIVFGTNSIITEKRNGIFTRSIIAGTNPLHMLLANVLRPFIYTTGQILSWAVAMYYFEEMEFRASSLIVLVGIANWIGIAGEAIGMVYGMLLDSHLTASIVVLGTYIPILMISGVLWPIESMPTWTRPILWLLPPSFSSRAFRDSCHRGIEFTSHRVYLGFVSLSTWFVVSTIVFLLATKRQKRIRFGL